jgi:uncharacterized protein (TIGR02453 family)
MITNTVFSFLNQLKLNNNRDWFHENKTLYNKAKSDFELFVNLMINEIGKFDNEVAHITAKESIFRIFRDIRFSKDKSPYKTNFGAFVSAGSKNSSLAGYYFHVEPGNCMLAGGIYMPPSPALKAVRQEIFDNTEEFREIISDQNFIHYFRQLEGDKLSSAPRGFPKDFKDIELLKYKNYLVMHSLKDEELKKEDFLVKMSKVFSAMTPLNHFINQAILENR